MADDGGDCGRRLGYLQWLSVCTWMVMAAFQAGNTFLCWQENTACVPEIPKRCCLAVTPSNVEISRGQKWYSRRTEFLMGQDEDRTLEPLTSYLGERVAAKGP